MLATLAASALVATVLPEFRIRDLQEMVSYSADQASYAHCLKLDFGGTLTSITGGGTGTFTRCVWVRGKPSNAWADKVYVPRSSGSDGHAAVDCPFKPSDYNQSGSGTWRHRHLNDTAPSSGMLDIPIFYAPGGNDPLSGGRLDVVYSEKRVDGSNTYIASHGWEYEVDKILCLDGSVDGRIAYGQQNAPYKDDASDATLKNAHVDPNSPPLNLNFGSWVYRGGLFAGEMRVADRDYSSRAHMQFWGEDSGSAFMASLNLFHLGPRQDATGAFTLNAYTFDENTNKTEMNSTWATRAMLEAPTNYVPVSSFPITSGWTEQRYVSWPLAKWDTTNNVFGTLYTDRVAIYPTDLPSNASVWRYFASREYQAIGGWSFPISDSRPRIWTIEEISHSGGSQ